MNDRIRWTLPARAALAVGLLLGCSSSVNGTACPSGQSPSCVSGGSCTCVPEGNIDSGAGSLDGGGGGFDSNVTVVDSSVPGIDSSARQDSSSGVDSSTFKDSGVATDSSTAKDSSAAVDSAAGTCPDNTAFTAITWAPPTPLHQGVCTAAQISAWASSQSMTTGLGSSGNAACDACIVTPQTAAAHGPAVTVTQGGTTFLAEFNIGGCIADEDGAKGAGSCGNQLNNQGDCLGQECASCSDFNSTTPSPTGPTALCEQAIFSAGGVCASDLIAQGSACATELALDGGVDQTCLSVATLQDLFTLWCGGSAPIPDAGSSDSGLACPPQSTSSYTAQTYTAAVAHQGLCTAVQISAFVTACGDNSTAAMCTAWLAANVAGGAVDGGGAGDACGNCILAPMNNGGTWTDPDGFFSPNYAACIQLTDATHGTACATAYDALSGCDAVACDQACAANDTSATDFQACFNAAEMGSCSTYATGLQSACTTDFADGGAASTCSPGTATGTLDPDLSYIATLICGP